jgi:RND family efflux transporter MFP subunit
VETVTVGRPVGENIVTASGALHREREVELGFRVGGVLQRISVEAGDPVARGQTLAQLDPAPFRIRLGQATAELRQAERNASRYQALADQGFVSRKQLEDQRSALAQAQAAYDAAAYDSRWSRLVAPADGVVLTRAAQAGEVVQSGQPVVTLADATSGFVLRAPVADRDVASIAVGAAATLELDGLPGRRLVGRVARIGEQADARSGAVMTEIAAPAAPGLRSGMIGRVRITAAAGAAATGAAQRVPVETVVEADAGRAVVYRLDQGDVARRMVVPFLGFQGEDALLDVAAGTRLITSGAGAIKDGDRVVATPARIAAGESP